jgi:hypothetical protein
LLLIAAVPESRQFEHVRIELRAVPVKAGQLALVTCADFEAIIKPLVRPIRKPKAQSVFAN